MRSRDQIILENLYSDKILLSEKLIGNIGWVYHRTWYNPENSDISEKGIQPSRNASAMYGKGLYCCYDLEQQFKENMRSYGRYILKGKIDLTNFVILDKDVFENAQPKENFENYLKKLGINFKDWQESLPYTSDIANGVWRIAKQKGYNGIIFTGRNDGKVAVIWNRNNFIPYQYALDEIRSEKPIMFSSDISLEWKNLNPNVKNIKRPYDPAYDEDIERNETKFNDPANILSPNSKIENAEENLYIRPNTIDSNKFYQPSLKKAKGLYITDGIKVAIFPELEEIEFLYMTDVKRCIMPKLKICKETFHIENANILDFRSFEESHSLSFENIEEVNLPEFKKAQNYIIIENVKIIKLPKIIESVPFIATNTEKIFLGDKKNYPDWRISSSKDGDNFLSTAKIYYTSDTAPQEQNESYNFKKFFLKESLIQIPLEQAYDIFKNEYEKSTGKSWDRNKFMGRASNWEFYGDDKGYVAIRRQRSGFVKLVGMAGDMRSKLKGMQDLLSMNLPLWGMVSKEIKDLAIRKGMRMPNILERQVLKRNIPSEVFGDAKILDYMSDGGIKIQYPDIGVVIKYLIGTPSYYSELRKKFGDKIKGYFNER